MPSVEERLAAIENRIGLGIFSSNSLDSLQTDVDQLKQLTSRLSALQETGNPVYGGPIRTVIAASWFTQVTQQVNITSADPYVINLIVPPEFLKIIYCRIKLYSRYARAEFPVLTDKTILELDATSPGAGTVIVSNTVHTHNLVSGVSGGPSSHMTGPTGTHTHGNSNGASPDTTSTEDAGASPIHAHTLSAHVHGSNAPSATVNVPHTDHNHTTANLSTGGPIGGQSTVANGTHIHSHRHEAAGHDHGMSTFDVRDFGSGLQGGRAIIDGIDRSVALGGPWTDIPGASWELDVTQYLNDVRGNPMIGDHSLQWTTTAVAGAGLGFAVQWYIIAKPTG